MSDEPSTKPVLPPHGRQPFPDNGLRTFHVPHPRVYAYSGGQLITKQEFKDETDINNILKMYKQTGIIQHINKNQPLYEDLPDQSDYQTSLNIIMDAENTFATLPSKVRDFFGNDPGRFLGAFSDPSMEDKLREFGLLKPVPPEPLPTNLTSPSQAPNLALGPQATPSPEPK